MIISLHNINFYQEFMKKIREEIKRGHLIFFTKKIYQCINTHLLIEIFRLYI